MDTTRERVTRRVASGLVTLGIAAVAVWVLVDDLARPGRIIFDETYYVEDARGYLDAGVEPSFAVHPPLGKWLIAAGIRFVGDEPLGWRLPGAIAGVLLVVVVHRLALRLLAGVPHGRLLAAVAPLLLLLDGVFLVQARTSMLDIFLALFTTTGIWLVVVDRDRAGLLGDAWPPPGDHRARLLAGVALGLALSVKWSGLLGLGVAGLLALVWEFGLRRRTGRTWRSLPGLVGSLALSLVVVPVVVYALSWVPWAANFEATSTADCDEDPATDDCSFTLADRALGVVDHQGEMWRFHSGLEAEHPYRSLPATWPLLARPVVYYYETCSQDRADGVLQTDEETGEVTEPDPCVVAQGEAGEIVLLGNLVVWWGFLLATPLLLGGLVERDRRSLVPLLGWAGQFLPWLAISRVAFLFYMVPAVPFLALGLVVAAPRLARRGQVLWPMVSAVLGGVAGGGLGLVGVALTRATTDTPLALAVGAGWAAGAIAGTLAVRPRPVAATTGAAADGADEQAPAPSDEVGTTTPVADDEGRDVPATDHADDTAADAPTDEAPRATTDDDADASDADASNADADAGADPAEQDAGATGEDRGDDGEDVRDPAPAAGADVDGREPPAVHRPAPRGGRWLVPGVAGVTLVLAVGLFVYFLPVWTGVPLPEDVIRERWWFDSWV